MALNVRFLKGTAEQYNGLVNKNADTFYYVDGKDLYLGSIKLSSQAEIDAAVARIAENESDIAALETKVQNLIDNAYDDTEVRELIAANAKAVADEKTRAEGIEADHKARIETMEAFWAAAAADGTDQNVIDTLKEIQEYIAADETGAAAMAASIQANADAIAAEKSRAEGIEAGLRTDVDAKVATATYNAYVAANDAAVQQNATDIDALEVALTWGTIA